MIGLIFAFLSILAFSFAIILKNVDIMAKSIFESANSAVELTITLCGVMCLWCGIMNVFEKKGLIKKISFAISPILKFLFPNAYKNNATSEISSNISANILGIGNAATPLGLAAMGKLNAINPNKGTASDDMVMLAVLNTASLDIFPATIIALRQSAGSQAPYCIVLPTIISSLGTVIFAVLITKLLSKVF